MPPPNCERLGVPGYEVTGVTEDTYHTDLGPRTAYVFTTAQQGEWVVVPPIADQRLHPQQVTSLNGASTALHTRQEEIQRLAKEKIFPDLPPKKRDEAEEKHQANIKFFTTNWPRLAHLFYGDSPLLPTELPAYNEVGFEDLYVRVPRIAPPNESPDGTYTKITEQACGRVDFLGEGPDGQMILVEFGNPTGAKGRGKSKQIGRQLAGVKHLITTTNHGESPPITPFLATYGEQRGNRDIPRQTIQLRQPAHFYLFDLIPPANNAVSVK